MANQVNSERKIELLYMSLSIQMRPVMQIFGTLFGCCIIMKRKWFNILQRLYADRTNLVTKWTRLQSWLFVLVILQHSIRL